MGLLDAALGMLNGNQTLGTEGNDTKAMLIQAAINMLSNSENQQSGGLHGIIGALQNAGLGDAVSSWIGTGQNQAVSGEQIQQALGGDQLSELANAAGISQDDAAGHLAQFLPGIIDKLTPNGEVPEHGSINPADLLQQFSSLFGNR